MNRSIPAGTKRRLTIISLALAISALIASLCAKWIPLFPGDLHLSLFFQSFDNQIFTAIMEWASTLFTAYPAALLVAITGLLIFWRVGKLEGIIIWLSGMISLVNDVFKWLINRPRPTPEQVHIIGINHGNGYPSGHTFFATIFLGILAYLLFTRIKSFRWRVTSLVVLILINLLVASSRIYLGAHWPSDVLGGYLIGGFFLTLLIWLYEYLKSKIQSRL